jgi:hemoglobin
MASIFERNGGFVTMRRVVSDFYDKVLDSDAAYHFTQTDMRALIQHQTGFIVFLTGGPGANYSDEVLERVHAHLGITSTEFKLVVELLEETLEDHDFPDADVDTVSKAFRDREPLIVTVRS